VAFEIRPIDITEYRAWRALAWRVFSLTPDDSVMLAEAPVFDLSRSLGVFEGRELVGGATSYSRRMTVPGGGTISVSAIAEVAVLPTHRRQGIMRALMQRQVADAIEQGHTALALTASESTIYGRFGYGVASYSHAFTIQTSRSAFRHGVNTGGRLRLLADREVASKELPDIWNRYHPTSNGELDRDQTWWDARVLLDVPALRGALTEAMHVVHEDEHGQPDGYISYALERAWSSAMPQGSVHVHELVALNDVARAALWRYVLDIDLVHDLHTFGLPGDEPLRWWLEDPRRLQTTAIADHLWMNIRDLPVALSARTYRVDDRLVFQVLDDSGSDRLILTVEGGHGRVERLPASSTVRPDLVLDRGALGSLYLGGVSASLLARGGRIVEQTPGTVERGDLLFSTARQPSLLTRF